MISKGSWIVQTEPKKGVIFVDYLADIGYDVHIDDTRSWSQMRLIMQLASKIEALEARLK